jgi:hypothetical protein
MPDRRGEKYTPLFVRVSAFLMTINSAATANGFAPLSRSLSCFQATAFLNVFG